MGTLNAHEQAEAVVRGLSWRDWDEGTLRIEILNAYPNMIKWSAMFKGVRYGEFQQFEPGQEPIFMQRLARRAASVLRQLNADE